MSAEQKQKRNEKDKKSEWNKLDHFIYSICHDNLVLIWFNLARKLVLSYLLRMMRMITKRSKRRMNMEHQRYLIRKWKFRILITNFRAHSFRLSVDGALSFEYEGTDEYEVSFDIKIK